MMLIETTTSIYRARITPSGEKGLIEVEKIKCFSESKIKEGSQYYGNRIKILDNHLCLWQDDVSQLTTSTIVRIIE